MSARMKQIEGTLTLGELRRFVAEQVRLKYPDEGFLDDELVRIVGGAFNAFNWGLIRAANEYGVEKLPSGSLSVIHTVGHLATQWMDRAGIIRHAMDTTGLMYEHAEYGVSQIEEKIDHALRLAETVHIEWLGSVTRSTKQEYDYAIYLSDGLRF